MRKNHLKWEKKRKVMQQVALNVILDTRFLFWPGFGIEKEKKRLDEICPFQIRKDSVIWSVRLKEYLLWQPGATQLQNEITESETYHSCLQSHIRQLYQQDGKAHNRTNPKNGDLRRPGQCRKHNSILWKCVGRCVYLQEEQLSFLGFCLVGF